jgi:type I restriction enzyme S subunit
MAAKSASPEARQILEAIGVMDPPQDWDTVRVESLLSDDRGIAVGVMYPGDHDPAGIPLIKAGDLGGSRINPGPEFRITPDKHREYRRTELAGGELLISLVGDVGRCALVPPQMTGWNAARAIAVLRFKTPTDGAFVRACLMSAPLQHLMQAWSTTTVQATLNLKEIRQIPLPWPPKRERDAIAHILGTLDDKIELNRRMNETLEAMARSLFKSWFVDFDPVRAKAEGRALQDGARSGQPRKPFNVASDLPWPGAEAGAGAEGAPGLPKPLADLFPTRLVDSELGEIPEGWAVGCVDDEFDLTMGQSRPGETYNESGEGLPFYQGRADFGSRFPTRRVYCTAPTRLARAGDTLISVRAPVGDINMATENCAIGRGVAAARHRSGSRSYSYQFMLGLEEVFGRFEAEGTVFGSIGKKDFHAISCVRPPRAVIAEFETMLAPLDSRIDVTERESRTLAGLRDALLPKLISGELRVRDAEKFIGKAI